MTSKQMATGIALVMILFSLVALAVSSAGATEVETASNAVEHVEKTAVESGSSSTGPPFPRIYMVVHNELPDGGSPDGVNCSLPVETADSWDTLAALANIIEMKFEFGNRWKVDTDRDGDCSDENTYMVSWLKEQSNALPANYWGVTIPHKRLAFGNGWYYHYDPPEPPTHWRIQHTQEVNQCVDQWPLRDTSGALSHWTAETHPMIGLNVLDHAVYSSGGSNVCSGDLYVDWWPDWIEVPVLGPVSAWDGVRLDLPGNMHGQLIPEANMDMDNCNDVRVINSNGDCGGAATRYGNLTFNAAHRDGIQQMFAQLHAQHPDWLILGNNAWWPEKGPAEDPHPPGYASKIDGTVLYPDINGTMVEDWTRNWWGDNTSKRFSFTGWSSPDPAPNQGWKSTDFARSVRTLVQWQDAGKMLVINGKWCNLPTEGINISAGKNENECGVDDDENDGIVEDDELEPWRKSREVRFTMALATMLGEYHNYIGLGTGFIPYWFDEYAVIPDPDYPSPEAPDPFRAAETKAEKAEGVGWLGWPATPTEDQMWAVGCEW